jgi:hypothetical protein
MDEHDRSDSHVGRPDFRRNGGRRQASPATGIFANEDEPATFSRRNLVPPRTNLQPEPADEFFDQLPHGRDEAQADSAPPAAAAAQADASETDAFFEHLSNQTSEQIAESATSEPANPPPVGSAHLPADVDATPRRRREPTRLRRRSDDSAPASSSAGGPVAPTARRESAPPTESDTSNRSRPDAACGRRRWPSSQPSWR